MNIDKILSERAQFEQRIVSKAMKDNSFRSQLMANPKKVMEAELGSKIPDGVEIKVLSESNKARYIVLPAPIKASGAGELSDEELETVSGGYLHQTDGSFMDGC